MLSQRLDLVGLGGAGPRDFLMAEAEAKPAEGDTDFSDALLGHEQQESDLQQPGGVLGLAGAGDGGQRSPPLHRRTPPLVATALAFLAAAALIVLVATGDGGQLWKVFGVRSTVGGDPHYLMKQYGQVVYGSAPYGPAANGATAYPSAATASAASAPAQSYAPQPAQSYAQQQAPAADAASSRAYVASLVDTRTTSAQQQLQQQQQQQQMPIPQAGPYPQQGADIDSNPVCTNMGTAQPDGPNQRTQYMYRAQNDMEYEMEAIDAADMLGVLWYLHNEVAYTSCPRYRMNNITRILRLKVTFYRPPELQKGRFMTSAFRAFDSGSCGPKCEEEFAKVGHSVGCQLGSYGPMKTQWYSLPGPCLNKKFADKDAACVLKYPSPRCDCDQPLGGHCIYHVERAGEVRLSELTGITDFGEFCGRGGKEYDRDLDKGIHNSFWNGFKDGDKIKEREQALLSLFQQKYPNMPLYLGPTTCAAVYYPQR